MPDRGCDFLGLCALSIAGAHRRIDVAKRVHAFDQCQPTVGVIAQADVGMAHGIGRLRRQLERSVVSGLPTEPEYQLLDRQVARVGWLLHVVPSDLESEWQVEGVGRPLPHEQGQRRTLAKLKPADGRLMHAYLVTELRLGPSAAHAGPSHLRSRSAHSFRKSATGIGVGPCLSTRRHAPHSCGEHLTGD